MCKISVLIPVYNTEKYLDKCVQSVLCQDFSDFEVLLIDDGSQNECAMACDRLAECDSRIKVFHNQNGGLSYSRNFGIKKASGEYIFFLDSDDYITKGALSFLYNKAKSLKADITACGFVIESGDNTKRVEFETCVLDKDALSEYLPALKEKNLIDTCVDKLYKTSFLRQTKVEFSEGEIFEDTDFNFRLLKHEPLIACFKECFYRYVQHGGSITKRFNENKLETLKKRYFLICEVSPENKPYWDFFYIRCCFSAFIDLYLEKKQRKSYIKKIISEELFNDCVKNCRVNGLYQKTVKTVAKTKSVFLISMFSYLLYLLKYRFFALFLKLK